MTEQKSPFLKVQLLRDNPKDVPNMARWREILGDHQGLSSTIIETHLSRMKNAL